jgi:hypothetical protein
MTFVPLCRHYLSAVAVLFTLSAIQDSAFAFTKAFTIQHWSANAIFSDKSKQLEYCSASLNNSEGMTVTYSVDRQFAWKLSISNRVWDFAPGHTINVNVKIGEEEFQSQRAVVVDSKTLEIQVIDPIAFFSRLQMGLPLRVQAGALLLTFDLAESDEVLSALVHCVTQGLSRKPQPKGPSARAAKPLQIGPAADVELRAEARSLMKDVLAQARITGARFVNVNETPTGYRGDVAWRTDIITGTLSVFSDDSEVALGSLPSHLFQNLRSPCGESLFLVSAPDGIDQIPIARLFSSCRTLQGTISAYHLAVPRNAGGFYLLATINNGFGFAGAKPAEDMHYRFRAVVMGVIAKQATSANDNQ